MPHQPDRPNSSAAFFVYGVFTLLLGVGFVLVGHYGRNVPYGEEWLFMPVLTGFQPLTTGWLWEQMHEHRFPLTRAMIAALFGLGGNDFRLGMYYNLLSMALVAAALVEVVRRLRGFTSLTDAFFPLLLLHPYHAEACLWNGHMTLVAPAVLCFVWLLVIVRGDRRLTIGLAVVMGTCLLFLPLSGSWGLLATPLMLLWVAGSTGFVWRKNGSRGLLLLTAFVLLTVAILPLYFIGYATPRDIPTSGDPVQILEVALQFLTNGFGPGGQAYWPYSGILVAVPFVATLALLLRVCWQGTPEERVRAFGFLSLIGSVIALGLATGYGRSLVVEFAGFLPRYLWTSAPWLCCAYLAWEIYGQPAVRQMVQMTLFLLAAFFVGSGAHEAVKEANRFREPLARLEDHLEAHQHTGGLPISVAMKMHADAYYRDLKPEPYLEALRSMKRFQVGSFRHLHDDTPYQEVLLSDEPAGVTAMTRVRTRWKGSGPESHLVFELPQPRHVAAVQFTFSLTNETEEGCLFRVSWKKEAGEDAEHAVQECAVDARKGVTVTTWVCQVIDSLHVYPDQQPFSFHLREIKLLLPSD